MPLMLPLTFSLYINAIKKKKVAFCKTYYKSTICVYIYKIKLEKRKKIAAENESDKSESEYK